MKKTLLLVIGLLLVTTLFYSCSEEEFFPAVKEHDDETAMNLRTGSSDPNQTVLGAKRTNPFTIEVMQQAWTALNNSKIPRPEVTDLYIKFTPKSIEDMILLEKADLDLFDFPLEYKVEKMGEYYVKPDYENGVFPEQYTVVKPDFSISGINFEVLARLHLSEFDAPITKKAFELTKNDWANYARGGGSNYIQEPDDEVVGGGGGGSSSPYTTNACGCQVYKDRRKPGGCIKVWDTQFKQMQGVRRVRVVVRNFWFGIGRATTDDNGCWKMNKRFGYRVWMKVYFESDRVEVRGMRGKKIWEFTRTLRDPHYDTGRHNDIYIQYSPSNDDGSKAKMYWYAATANNALHEYYDFAQQDNIATPPKQLRMLVFNAKGTAAAPMLKQMHYDDFISFVNLNFPGALQAIGEDELISQMFGATRGAKWAMVIANLALAVFNNNAPDVSYAYGGETSWSSDRIKRILYHEFAHTSHYEAVGDLWWYKLIVAAIKNRGHGDQHGFYAGRVSLSESWADFLGMTYAHRQYPSNYYWSKSWEERLEHTWNEKTNHVPIGLLHDLIDGRGLEQPSWNLDFSGWTTINDQVEGFTIQQLYQALQPQILNMQNYKQELENSSLPSTSNTQAQFDGLFSQYGI